MFPDLTVFPSVIAMLTSATPIRQIQARACHAANQQADLGPRALRTHPLHEWQTCRRLARDADTQSFHAQAPASRWTPAWPSRGAPSSAADRLAFRISAGPVLRFAPSLPSLAGSNQRAAFKRASTHIAIAYFIFYQQRTAMLQQLFSSNPMLASKLLQPSSFDPTFEARLLRDRAESQKTLQAQAASHGPLPSLAAPA